LRQVQEARFLKVIGRSFGTRQIVQRFRSIVISPNKRIAFSIRRAKSMLRKFKSLRRDYPAMLSVVVILLGTFVLGGIAYTYTHRPTKLFDAASHLLERHKVPADL
jgi:hypothetical protein